MFILLETVYNAFDRIAKKRKVFKVETIGDSYLAVCGLPTPRKDHAVVMARFASDCCVEFRRLCHHLEVELGPDTSELGMRFGLHSGPVTAVSLCFGAFLRSLSATDAIIFSSPPILLNGIGRSPGREDKIPTIWGHCEYSFQNGNEF